MAHAVVGAGSAYAYTAEDADGHALDGSETYSLRIPAEPPAKNFWSVDVYDTQTRSLLQSTLYPALSSLSIEVRYISAASSSGASDHPARAISSLSGAFG